MFRSGHRVSRQTPRIIPSRENFGFRHATPLMRPFHMIPDPPSDLSDPILSMTSSASSGHSFVYRKPDDCPFRHVLPAPPPSAVPDTFRSPIRCTTFLHHSFPSIRSSVLFLHPSLTFLWLPDVPRPVPRTVLARFPVWYLFLAR